MFEKIRFKTKRFFLRLLRSHSNLTDRGRYEFYYLIDRYINQKELEYIKDYETALFRLKNTEGFEALYKNFFPESLEDTEEEIIRKHIFSIYVRLSVILDILCDEDKNELLNHIEDEKKRIIISEFMKELIG